MRYPIRSLVAAALLTFGAWAPAAAQKHPDFSGTFVLVPAKSDFGPMPPVASRTDVIDHKDPNLVIKRTIGDTPVNLTMAADGKQYKNTTPQGEVTSTLAWIGDQMVITSSVDTPNGPATLIDTMTLSADGKTLTQKRVIQVGGQEIAQTMVLERK
jgi:hypothetical protein